MSKSLSKEQWDALGVLLRDAVTEGYLDTGKSLDVGDLSMRLGWSEGRIRRVLDACHGAPKGVMTHQDFRENQSRLYPGFVSAGGHRVTTYTPALWHLRGLLTQAREELNARKAG